MGESLLLQSILYPNSNLLIVKLSLHSTPNLSSTQSVIDTLGDHNTNLTKPNKLHIDMSSPQAKHNQLFATFMADFHAKLQS